jgi:putative ABC transport system permease protein
MNFLQDLRYAGRLLQRSPAFALTSISVLALAIGANAAIFSAVQGILIEPLPYPNPDRLVRLFEEAPGAPHFPLAPSDFRDYRTELRTFEGLAAYMRSDLQMAEGDRPENLRGMQATAGFFTVVGWKPAMGRDFVEADELKGSEDVAILSHALWLRRFEADPAIVGRTVRLSGRTFRIVGVLPPGFQHVGGTYRTYAHGEAVDVWWVLRVPRESTPGTRYSHFYNVVGRLRPGGTKSDMLADVGDVGRRVAQRYPEPNSPYVPRIVPLKEEIVGSSESTLVALSVASAVVLVLACVNVAGLLLGRAAARAREIGVRAALGASRARLLRQLLIESAVLAAVGGAIGVALSYGAVAALAAYGPADMPRLQTIAVNGVVLGYTVVATLASALLFGVAPALQLARAGVGETLKQGGRTVAGGSHQRLRRVLVGVEIALAFVLVVCGGLLLRSFVAMIETSPGFDARNVMTASIELPVAKYPTRADAALFFGRALEEIGALPGVRSVGFSSDLPWTGYDENTGFEIVGRTLADDDGAARYHFLSPGYAAAVGTPLIAGRDVSASDTGDGPFVVLVNESLARKYWSSADAAVGARVRVWGRERMIAGVIGDVRDAPWSLAAVPAVYFPVGQEWPPQRAFLVVRSAVDPASLTESIRRAVNRLDPALPLANVRPLEGVAGAAIAGRRLTLWLVSAFGLTALILAIVGIYGVMAQNVAQRTHEFGVRQALGATRGDIMRHVLTAGTLLTLAGLAAGLLLSAVSVRLLTSMLYGVTPGDPVTFAWVTALLLATAVCASYLPARRATAVSPATALRNVE